MSQVMLGCVRRENIHQVQEDTRGTKAVTQVLIKYAVVQFGGMTKLGYFI